MADLVLITKPANGILFDSVANNVPTGTTEIALKRFIPKDFPEIRTVLLYGDRVTVVPTNGEPFNLDLDSNEGFIPVSHIAASAVSDLEDLFDKFIALL